MVVCAELFARTVLGIQPSDRCFSVAKLFFAYGLGNALYFPFAVGATTILWPGPPTPPHVYAVIERHRPTLFFSVPTSYAMLLAHTRPESRLRSVEHPLRGVGGRGAAARALRAVSQRFGVDILDGIGSTEMLHMFISNRPGAIRPGSSGQLVPGYEARLSTTTASRSPPGEIGNCWISGDSTCACYWNQHEKTKDTIEGHWIRTGDKYHAGRRRLLLVRRPVRRHAQGRRACGSARSRSRTR